MFALIHFELFKVTKEVKFLEGLASDLPNTDVCEHVFSEEGVSVDPNVSPSSADLYFLKIISISQDSEQLQCMITGLNFGDNILLILELDSGVNGRVQFQIKLFQFLALRVQIQCH